MPSAETQANPAPTRKNEALPLRYQTPKAWAQQVMADPLALLNDHAHLEKKAGTNALELLNRWPLPVPLPRREGLGEGRNDRLQDGQQNNTQAERHASPSPSPSLKGGENGSPTHDALTLQWIQTMTAVAKDEVDHLGIVLRILFRRGGRFTKSHRNAYAAQLRDEVRLNEGPNQLLDRLIISALIEARSCERFEVLGEHCGDDELRKLYRDLANSERGHFIVFLNLARELPGNLAVEQRWDEMLDIEAATIQCQPPGPRMHSGVL